MNLGPKAGEIAPRYAYLPCFRGPACQLRPVPSAGPGRYGHHGRPSMLRRKENPDNGLETFLLGVFYGVFVTLVAISAYRLAGVLW